MHEALSTLKITGAQPLLFRRRRPPFYRSANHHCTGVPITILQVCQSPFYKCAGPPLYLTIGIIYCQVGSTAASKLPLMIPQGENSNNFLTLLMTSPNSVFFIQTNETKAKRKEEQQQYSLLCYPTRIIYIYIYILEYIYKLRCRTVH